MADATRKTRRFGMTRKDYTGAHLLQNVNKKAEIDVPPRKASPDIFEAPLSSSDEEGVSLKRKLEATSTEVDQQDLALRSKKKRATRGKVIEGMSPRSKSTRRLARSAAPTPNDGPDEFDPREEDIFSSSQQQRRKARAYGRPKIPEREDSINIHANPTKEDDGFKVPMGLDEKIVQGGDAWKMPKGLIEPRRTRIREPTSEFKLRPCPLTDAPRPPSSDAEFQQKVLKIADPILRAEVQEALDASSNGFIMRENPLSDSGAKIDGFASSSTTVDDVFSLKPNDHSRSSSSSSLSSVVSSHQSQKSSKGLIRPPLTTLCPLCRGPVPRDFLESYNNGRRLNFKDQHKFCHDHRLNSAETVWKEKGFPEIEWSNFENSRITKRHIARLQSILQGKISSHYATILSEHSAHGPKALQQYFKDTIVDHVSAGYYGPRGNKAMGQAIQGHLSKQLHQSARRNELVRDAGAGGYVQAVLVPELTVMLVEEDLGVEDAEEARKVLRESLEIGVLVNGEVEDVIVEDVEE